MSASHDHSNVVPFFRGALKPADWSPQELANFYKVEHLLLQNGLAIEVDRGTTDEGEPWFVFCHDNGDVFLHFARLGGSYLVAGPNIPEPIWNRDFSSLLKTLQDRVPLAIPKTSGDGATLLMHPSVLLVAAVVALFYQSSSLKAEELGEPVHSPVRNGDNRNASSVFSEFQAASLIAAIALMAGVESLNVEGSDLPEFVPQPLTAAVEIEAPAESDHALDIPMVAASTIRHSEPAAEMEPDTVETGGGIALMDSVIADIPAPYLQQYLHDEPAWADIAALHASLFDDAIIPAAPLVVAIDINAEATSKPQPPSSADREASVAEPSAPLAEPAKTDPKAPEEDKVVVVAVADAEAAVVSIADQNIATTDWQDVKVFVTFVGNIPVLVANTSYNLPQGPDAQMVALDSLDGDKAAEESFDAAILDVVGIASYGDDAFAMS